MLSPRSLLLTKRFDCELFEFDRVERLELGRPVVDGCRRTCPVGILARCDGANVTSQMRQVLFGISWYAEVVAFESSFARRIKLVRGGASLDGTMHRSTVQIG